MKCKIWGLFFTLYCWKQAAISSKAPNIEDGTSNVRVMYLDLALLVRTCRVTTMVLPLDRIYVSSRPSITPMGFPTVHYLARHISSNISEYAFQCAIWGANISPLTRNRSNCKEKFLWWHGNSWPDLEICGQNCTDYGNLQSMIETCSQKLCKRLLLPAMDNFWLCKLKSDFLIKNISRNGILAR